MAAKTPSHMNAADGTFRKKTTIAQTALFPQNSRKQKDPKSCTDAPL